MLTPRSADLLLDSYPHKEDLIILRDAIDARLRREKVLKR